MRRVGEAVGGGQYEDWKLTDGLSLRDNCCYEREEEENITFRRNYHKSK